MGSARFTRSLIAFVVASSVTAGAYFIDRQRSETLETQAALRWARQITSQVDSMALSARTRGEEDPLGWAVDYLTQGIEPRLIRVSRVSPEYVEAGTDGESWRLNRSAGTFDYSRVLDSSAGNAIRIDLDLGYSGFAGSKFRLTNDLSIAGIFAIVFALFYLQAALSAARRLISELQERLAQALTPSEASKSDPEPDFSAAMPVAATAAIAPVVSLPAPPVVPPVPMIPVAQVSRWVLDSKSAVAAVAREVRDLLRQAQVVIATARESETAAGSVRERIHSNLSDLHGSRLALRQASVWMSQLEKLAHAPTSEESQRKLQIALAKVREVCVRNEKMLLDLEQRIEPLAADADHALEANRKIIAVANGDFGVKIETTKRSLLAQSRLQQKFNSELAKAQSGSVELSTPMVESTSEAAEPVARFYAKESVPSRPVRKRTRKSA